MKLSTVFSQLSSGEFSQLALGQSLDDFGIPEDRYNAVADHVHLGLTELYKRFDLKKGSLVLQLQTDLTTYPLRGGYTVSGGSLVNPNYIIDDVVFPFMDDILKIESVYTSNGVHELPLNNGMNLYSCHTPVMDTLRVPLQIVNKMVDTPEAYITDNLLVEYRAKHPILYKPGSFIDPERVNIELPESHLNALLLFVASRVHNPIGMSNEFHVGNNYAAKYEQECQRLENEGLQIDFSDGNHRLNHKGWV